MPDDPKDNKSPAFAPPTDPGELAAYRKGMLDLGAQFLLKSIEPPPPPDDFSLYAHLDDLFAPDAATATGPQLPAAVSRES